MNFFSFFCSAEGLYEGTPLYPALFSNARDRISFQNIQFWILIGVNFTALIFSPLCVIAYGSNLRDFVLLNLEYGTF